MSLYKTSLSAALNYFNLSPDMTENVFTCTKSINTNILILTHVLLKGLCHQDRLDVSLHILASSQLACWYQILLHMKI